MIDASKPAGVDPRVRPLLVCPKCRGDLEDVDGGLRCPVDALVYPVDQGTPILIPESARKG